MSPILPNMSVRTALHRPILTPSPKGLGRQGCHPRPPSGVFRPLGGAARHMPMAPSLRRLIRSSIQSA